MTTASIIYDDNFDGHALAFCVALEREQSSSSAAGTELGHAVAAAKRANGQPASVAVDESEVECLCLDMLGGVHRARGVRCGLDDNSTCTPAILCVRISVARLSHDRSG